MKCPVCEVDLIMSERQGVEIDYCPKCRGVWLDRGELDKIIDRSETSEREISNNDLGDRDGKYESRDRDYDRNYREDEREHGKSYDGYKKKKRGGFLGDIFDFGD